MEHTISEYRAKSKKLSETKLQELDLGNVNSRCGLWEMCFEDAYEDRYEVRCLMGHCISRADSHDLAISKARQVQHAD